MELLGYTLYYYLEPGREPFGSITSLSPEDAMKKAAELAPDTRSPKNRFCAEDFPGYYEKRLETEAWLHRSFVEQGGEPVSEHPLYFTLGSSDFLHKWFGSGAVYTFSVAALPQSRLSFTLGDSMSVVDREERRVYTAAGMAGLLESHGLEELVQSCGIRYVEAQLWDTAPPTPLRIYSESR